MISFKQFLSEMADETGDGFRGNFNKKHEWDEFYKQNSTLIAKDIGSQHYKVYRNHGNFFLTDENNEYLGQLEGTVTKNNTFKISSSSAEPTVKGFYNIMFTVILGNTDIKEINSDESLSTNAINLYARLSQNSRLNIKIKNGYDIDNTKYVDFDKTELLKPNKVVAVYESSNLHKLFETYYTRIYQLNENNRPSGFNLEFTRRSGGIDRFLFCENYSNVPEF